MTLSGQEGAYKCRKIAHPVLAILAAQRFIAFLAVLTVRAGVKKISMRPQTESPGARERTPEAGAEGRARGKKNGTRKGGPYGPPYRPPYGPSSVWAYK